MDLKAESNRRLEKKMHKEDHHFYSSPNIIRAIKSREMMRAKHASDQCMRNIHNVIRLVNTRQTTLCIKPLSHLAPGGRYTHTGVHLSKTYQYNPKRYTTA